MHKFITLSIVTAAIGVSSSTHAAQGVLANSVKKDYPSCDLGAQHELEQKTDQSNKDQFGKYIFDRAEILQADIGHARKARRVSQKQADLLWGRVDDVLNASSQLIHMQSFLSAAESATYDRKLDSVASTLCKYIK